MIESGRLRRTPLTLGQRRVHRVLPIVEILIVLPAKIEPGVGILMREQGRRVDVRVGAVDGHRFPPPRAPALRGQGVRWRTDSEQVQPEQLAVAVPAIDEKPRFRLPAMRKGPAAIERPDPVDPRINSVYQRADLRIVEILPHQERPLEEQRRVNRRRFAPPHPRSGVDIDKVIDPSVFLGHGSIDGTEHGQHVLCRRFPVEPAAVEADTPGG